MTDKEKNLLLKDLCARLTYGVKYDCMYGSYKGIQELTPIELQDILDCDWLDGVNVYLRPMSSMAEEERKEYNRTLIPLDYYDGNTIETFDWLNKKMFDYRGLIKMGLALEAPEGMYGKEGEE